MTDKQPASSTSGHSHDVSRVLADTTNTYCAPKAASTKGTSAGAAEVRRSSAPVVVVFDATSDRLDRIQRLNAKSTLWTKR